MMRSLGLNPSDADIKVHVDVFYFDFDFFFDVDCDCVFCPTILMLTLFFILMLMHKLVGHLGCKKGLELVLDSSGRYTMVGV